MVTQIMVQFFHQGLQLCWDTCFPTQGSSRQMDSYPALADAR